MTRLFVHNYTMRVTKDTKTLAEFVSEVFEAKDLTARKVAANSGNGISHSYVNKIKNGDARNPSPAQIKALAKGLDEPEELLFSIVRGKITDNDKIAHEKLSVIDFAYPGIPKQKRANVDYLIDLLDNEIKKIKAEEK